jgi:hypothetical protein
MTHDGGSIQDLIPAATCLSERTVIAFIGATIRSVACYSDAEVEIASVPLSRARVLVNCVIRDRLYRARNLLTLYEAAGIPPFAPAFCRSGGLWTLCVPPIVEHNGDLSIVDGSHRSYAAHVDGIRDIAMTVVRGCRLPRQAADAHDWHEIETVPFVAHWTERFTNLDPSLFRPVSLVFRQVGRQGLPIDELLSVIKSKI